MVTFTIDAEFCPPLRGIGTAPTCTRSTVISNSSDKLSSACTC